MTLAERQDERFKLVTRMREINDLSEKEKRSFNEAEQTEYTKTEARVDELDAEIRADEDREKRAAKLKDLETRVTDPAKLPATKPTPTPDPQKRSEPVGPRATPEYRDMFRAYLGGGMMAAERHLVEKRVDTLQVGLFTKGGALVAPEQMVAELLKFVDETVFVDRFARHFRLTSALSLGVPTLDTDVDDFDWTAELLTGSATDLAVGGRALTPHPMAKNVKISKTLNRISSIPIDQLVRERLGYKVGVTREKAFLTGDGNQKPLGIFTASALGVPTSRDSATDNTATAMTADGLIEAKHLLKAQYWSMARWVFHRDGIKNIRKLKDGQGNYLWQPGLAGLSGQGSTILDLPYDISEFAPNTFTASLYVGALCAWPFYWIADALDMTVQFLDQLYAATNTDGYIARMETDGAPVLAEAFVRVKLGA
jgi:HK97 family phage major capsid protein